MVYFVERDEQLSMNHRIHIYGCPNLPKSENRIYMGHFDNWEIAENKARDLFVKVEVCEHCRRRLENN